MKNCREVWGEKRDGAKDLEHTAAWVALKSTLHLKKGITKETYIEKIVPFPFVNHSFYALKKKLHNLLPQILVAQDHALLNWDVRAAMFFSFHSAGSLCYTG